jgi:hypothetical protein
MQLLTPLLPTSDHQGSGCSNTTSGNGMWGKLKQGTYQIFEELTAPPTIGAVSGHQFITTIRRFRYDVWSIEAEMSSLIARFWASLLG